MEKSREALIEATVFCTHHQVEHSFIYALEESGLVELVVLEEQKFIPQNQLPHLEKIIRLHHELDINLAGIEVVINLLRRMEQMQQSLNRLENRLRRFEE